MSPATSSPIRQFVLKVASRCDLACDYCYIYQLPDQRWRTRPRTMSHETVDRAAERIAEHARDNALPAVDVVLHGGEPLIAGPELLGYCVRRVRTAAGPGVRVRAAVQTNGVRLNRPFLELFRQLDVRVGVSLDGGPTAHDRHRRDRRGNGTHQTVVRAVRTLAEPRYRRLYAGLLCTVDLANDPVRVHDALTALRPPVIDLLLPHGTWAVPPPGRDPGSADAPYGRWLAAVFDRWHDAPAGTSRIRLFEEIIRVLLGRPSRLEGIGTAPAGSIVVETDGGIEESDHLATTSGAGVTGLNVATSGFAEALALPTARARRAGAAALSRACLACPVVGVCGGGLYTHRYRPDNGFDNPSVYCPDLRHLIEHIRARLLADVRALGHAA
ncbi:FxsB family cyclophane-forming radical SAM/SPASM peptide maturase [Actinoplanes siamensis]|uniref:Radical SAM protein n=1 Tax=Actinoplanes siamensis TaxID=1223317 RepID=A0A919TKN9_9ACTN|nr:FxsB family cyclophane-forming radical SAM/SPASM peptide maturase [Actinoplanes siamensis]GIF05469.1 radical SAM protein [Actinoplanes siamensis]